LHGFNMHLRHSHNKIEEEERGVASLSSVFD